MKPFFFTDRRGATAVEFALLAPALLLLAGAIFGFGLAFWTKNALQETASETARCAAIGSPSCSTITGTCDSAVPAVCYLETLAARRGVAKVSGSVVAVNSSASIGSTSFTVVTVDYPMAIFGYNFVLHVTGHFPNPT